MTAALPVWGLLILVSSAPLVGVVWSRGLGTVPVVCAALCLAGYLLERRRPPVDRTFAALLGGLLALGALSALWALDAGYALASVAKIAPQVAAGLILHAAARDLDDAARRRLAGVFLAAFALGTVGLAVEMAGHLPLHRLFGIEAPGPWTLNRHAVTLALLLGPAALAARRLGRPWLGGALGVGLFAAVAITESQSALVAVPVGGAVWLLARVAAATTRRTLAVAVAVGILGAPWLALALFRLQPAALMGWEAASVLPRMEIWDAVAHFIVERPLLGWGLEGTRFIPNLIEATQATIMRGRIILHPHNAALQIWVELGLAGAAVMTALALLALRRIGRLAEADQAAALAAFAAAVTVAVISHGLWQGWWLGLLGTTAAAVALTREAAAAAALTREAATGGAVETR